MLLTIDVASDKKADSSDIQDKFVNSKPDKVNHNNNSDNISSAYFLKFFFDHYLWFGLFLILLSIVLESYLDTKIYIIKIIVNIIETTGVAILISAIFTFASGTSEFLGRISALLRDIIIDKEFLNNLDIEGKKMY